LELARAGVDTLVIEKGLSVGWEASSRSMGSLRIQGREPAEIPLAVEALRRWRELASKAEFEFVEGGNLYLAEHDRELDVLRSLHEQAVSGGLEDVRLLDSRGVERLVPLRDGASKGGLYSPYDAQCDPQRAVAEVARLAEQVGARFLLGERVTEVLVRGEKVRGVATAAHGSIMCSHVVVACGVGTPRLIRTLGLELPIKAVGVTQAESRAVSVTFRPTLRAMRFSARQRPDGRLVLGAGLETRADQFVSLSDFTRLVEWLPRYWVHRRNIRLSFDLWPRGWQYVRGGVEGRSGELAYPGPNQALIDRAARGLSSVLAGSPEIVIDRYWIGLVDHTLDGLPVIESLDRPAGLQLAAGFSGHGLGIAPAVGGVVAAAVLGATPPLDIGAFSIRRFAAGRVPIPERFI
jgi:glycine/D-amino acid oxidase-like deaminating enzyme